MESSKQPLLKFLEANFLEVVEAWKLSSDEWNRMFVWYISTGNIFQFLRGATMLGFVLFRPMTKEQLENRHKFFEWTPEGEFLYVPLFVVKQDWKGRGMWNLMKGLAAHTYPSVRFIAYESWKDNDQQLNIMPVPSKHEGRRKNGKEKPGTSSTDSVDSSAKSGANIRSSAQSSPRHSRSSA